MTQIPKNPFDREDWFSEVVKSNDSIMNSSKKELFEFQTKYNPQSMTKFQKVLTFFTTHTITAVVTASICLGGIATFAAQTVAPEQYKPSTVVSNLFKNNKIQQTNPNTPLVSDAQNDVVSYDPCNISIKYPKQIAGDQIIAAKPEDYNQSNGYGNFVMDIQNVAITTKKLFLSKEYNPNDNNLNALDISCSKDVISPVDNNLNSKMTIQELAGLTGWFITGEQKLEEIRTENQITAGPFRTIYFKFNNFYYKINFVTNKLPVNYLDSVDSVVKQAWTNTINKPGIFGDQVQIQFNNVANNIPNAEILKFDNVATGGFLFEYDKKLELKNKEKFEFSDPSKNNTFYVVTDKTLQDKITQLGLSNGDSIIFSGQVTNSNSTINITKAEEFTITKINKVEKINKLINSQNVKSGKIFGKLSYPSEGLPGVNVCAENTQSKKIICSDRVTGGWDGEGVNLNYSLELDSGEYEIYSTANNSNNTKAYYDQVSECGNGAIDYDCSQKFPKPKPVKVTITEGAKKELSGWNWYVINNENQSNSSPLISPDGKNKLYYGGSETTPQGESTIRTDGPNTSEKNGLIVTGNLFVPKSQSVLATESIDEYSPLDCDIVAMKTYANNSNGQLFVTNNNSYMANGLGSYNSTPARLNQLKEFIKNGKGEVGNSINAFHSGCGGFATQSMKELGYTNQNGRQTRSVLVASGQEAIADANVYVFVQQGDKLAMMSTMAYSDVFEKCRDFGLASNNMNSTKYIDCMQDLMKNNTEVEKFAKSKMQELLTSFEMN